MSTTFEQLALSQVKTPTRQPNRIPATDGDWLRMSAYNLGIELSNRDIDEYYKRQRLGQFKYADPIETAAMRNSRKVIGDRKQFKQQMLEIGKFVSPKQRVQQFIESQDKLKMQEQKQRIYPKYIDRVQD